MAATQGRACRAASSACPLASSTVWSVRPTRRPPSGLDTAILYTRGAPSVCALPPPAGRVPRPLAGGGEAVLALEGPDAAGSVIAFWAPTSRCWRCHGIQGEGHRTRVH